MSDERKIEEELESEDDVEAHGKLKQANDDGSDDVEAHGKLKQANDEGSDDDGDVEAHMKVKA